MEGFTSQDTDTEIIIQYKLLCEPKILKTLIGKYYPAIESLSETISIHNLLWIDPDELIRFGFLGLIEAVETINLGRGDIFKDYVHKIIKGAIFNGLSAAEDIPNKQKNLILMHIENFKVLQPTANNLYDFYQGYNRFNDCIKKLMELYSPPKVQKCHNKQSQEIYNVLLDIKDRLSQGRRLSEREPRFLELTNEYGYKTMKMLKLVKKRLLAMIS